MGSYTYPVARPEGTLTPAQVHLLLSRPSLIVKRLADITKMGFIADYLLQSQFTAAGGGVFYETGDDSFAPENAESVAPGAGYPKVVLPEGDIVAAKTVKWGLETDVTDEKIARQGMVPVNRGLTRLGNQVIKNVDTVAWGVIASKVTSTFASPATWTTAGAIIEALTSIQLTRANLGLGHNLDTVVLPPAKWAKLIKILVDDKALPREQGNIVQTGKLPVDALGFTWVTSPFVSGTDPWLFDTELLGGMADEKLGSPGYVESGGIEAKSKYDDDAEKYVLRARRVTVPIVTDPLAGVKVTGTSL